MSEPLPHYVNIAKKLKSYGIDAYDDPMMFILGGKVVTAEIDANRALQQLRSVLERVTSGDVDLDSFDAGQVSDTAEAVAAYQRARRELLKTADEQGLLRSQATVG
jgi:hypothetical protein